MILDNLATTRVAYENMDVRLAKAFAWLRATDLDAIPPDEKIFIDGERVYAMSQSYETIEPHIGSFEAHRNYIDIQIMVAGEEIMYWAPLSDLAVIKKEYNYGKDAVFFEEPAVSVPLLVRAGEFAVFFPSDGHKPRCRNGNPETIRKIVVKIAV